MMRLPRRPCYGEMSGRLPDRIVIDASRCCETPGSPLTLLWRRPHTISSMAEQIAALPEAARVTMMRDLAGDDPDRYQGELISSLVSLSQQLGDLGYLE